MKKSIVLVLAMVLGLGLVGCGLVSNDETMRSVITSNEYIEVINSETYSMLKDIENLYTLADELGISDEELGLMVDREIVEAITSDQNN